MGIEITAYEEESLFLMAATDNRNLGVGLFVFVDFVS